MSKIKLYFLTGFLGAGKTTILRNLLENMEGTKVGVIQNELGKISIDGTVLQNNDIQMIELNRGSIFCSCLRLSFVDALTQMAQKGLEYVFVESSGFGDPSNAEEILAKFDVIVDASDNFPTRYLLSDTCMKLGKPDVYGAICEFAGQVTVFASDGPCLRCLCPEAEDPSGNPNSAAYGVLGVIPGMIGCMQAAEVLKLLLGKGEPLIGKMLFIDAKTWSTDLIEVPVHPQCSCHAHTKVHRM